MKNTTTTFELNPIVFTAEYITTHLLPVVQRPSEDNTLMKESFLDLELIFKVIIEGTDTDSGFVTYRLTKALAESLHLDMEFLRSCAYLNNCNRITCQSIAEIFGLPDTMTEMYVLSNESRNLGAGTAFLCTAPLQELCRKWNTDEIKIIPSSIHELIAIKADSADAEYINSMIRDINESIVSENERLSDHYYIYHSDDTFTF